MTPAKHPVLDHVILGHAPVIDRRQAIVALRLTVFAVPDGAAADAGALLRALREIWPAPADGGEAPLRLRLHDVGAATAGGAAPAVAPGAAGNPVAGGAGSTRPGAAPSRGGAAGAAALAGAALPPVVLTVADEGLLMRLLQADLPPHFMVEVPAFMAADTRCRAALRDCRERGSPLLLGGTPARPLDADTAACFTHAVLGADDAPAAGAAPAVPGGAVLRSGVRSSAAAARAFDGGAAAVIGWPLDDALPAPGRRVAVPPDVQVVLALIAGVEREEPVARLEAVLRREPTLAFKLLRYINSPAFGMSVEINSFGHALMLLGYQRLKRWLALLLAGAGKTAAAPVLMHAAVRRGLVMEQLAGAGADAETKSEMFICGVFSLLDRLLGQPFEDLLGVIPVSDAVQRTLAGTGGPYSGALALVRALEQGAAPDIGEAADALLLGRAEANDALLRGLHAAGQLDG